MKTSLAKNTRAGNQTSVKNDSTFVKCALVDPAVAFLRRHGAEVEFNTRLRRLDFAGERVGGLDGRPLGTGDSVVLAVPPRAAADLVPDLQTPSESRSIVNAHFRLPNRWSETAIIGVIGGVSQWVFVRGEIASVTISAAENLVEDLAAAIWPEVAAVLEIPRDPTPPHRIVKEKRATFAQTPDQVARRPGTTTGWRNLFLAGDWTDTGLPATIEGAVRSGHAAAAAVVKKR